MCRSQSILVLLLPGNAQGHSPGPMLLAAAPRDGSPTGAEAEAGPGDYMMHISDDQQGTLKEQGLFPTSLTGNTTCLGHTVGPRAGRS